MPYTVNAQILGNEQALSLIAALAAIGIPQGSIRVIEYTNGPEHRDDKVSGRSLTWGLLGAAIGATFGWIVMSWWSLPWIGALWGAVVGAICAARTGGESVAKVIPGTSGMPSTRVEIDARDHHQTELARRICIDHRAWAIKVVGGH